MHSVSNAVLGEVISQVVHIQEFLAHIHATSHHPVLGKREKSAL